MCLTSQFTSEAKHALESQREHLINEDPLELSRRREQGQHLQAELQLKAASHVPVSPAGLCFVTAKLGYDTARKRAIQMSLQATSRCSHFSRSGCSAGYKKPSTVKYKVSVPDFKMWRTSLKSEVSHSSSFPKAALALIGEIENAGWFEARSSTDLIHGKSFPASEVLDPTIAGRLRKSITENVKRRVVINE